MSARGNRPKRRKRFERRAKPAPEAPHLPKNQPRALKDRRRHMVAH
jgi:hypothetical protein